MDLAKWGKSNIVEVKQYLLDNSGHPKKTL